MRSAFISDCEGPISKNDNAFELTSRFVPNGDKLFTVISRYDDVLADVLKRPGYKAGDTLKLILPFLKAYDVTDQRMQDFSAECLVLIPNAKDTLQYIRKIAHAFIVSTSYEHYIKSLCQALNFPYVDAFCTRVNVNEYSMTKEDTIRLKEFAREISRMPIIKIPSEAKTQDDFSREHQNTIRRLDEIFWREIANMDSGRILREVNPVGGREKADAVNDAVQRIGVDLKDVMYVGDSITDVEAFKLVKDGGGLAISFNGNQYAIRNTELAVLSENTIVTAIIADVFCRFGKQEVISLVRNWSDSFLEKSCVDQTLLKRLFLMHLTELPKVKIITIENMETLVKESSQFRKKVRGEMVGVLG